MHKLPPTKLTSWANRFEIQVLCAPEHSTNEWCLAKISNSKDTLMFKHEPNSNAMQPEQSAGVVPLKFLDY
jgi:hypothetical protein